MIRWWRRRGAYNRARLTIIRAWRNAARADFTAKGDGGEYSRGYRDGLDTAVRALAKELAGVR